VTLMVAASIAGLILYAATAAGLMSRGRWRLSGFFAVHVVFSWVVLWLITCWPDYFYRQWFFLILHTIAAVLRIGIATELAWRIFRPFPNARKTALLAIATISAITAFAATTGPLKADGAEWEMIAGRLFPILRAGTVWSMAAPLLLALWYHVPVRRFHAEVLTSWVLYLGVTTLVLKIQAAGVGFAVFGVNGRLIDDLANVPDFLQHCYWVYIAWRPDNATVIAHDATLRQLENGLPSCG
jgi:hypothetical protein